VQKAYYQTGAAWADSPTQKFNCEDQIVKISSIENKVMRFADFDSGTSDSAALGEVHPKNW
jgi:hypothetical protein